MKQRIASLSFIFLLAFTQVSCDPKFGLAFNLALVGVDRVVDARVAAGKITQPKGEMVKQDFGDLRTGGTVFDADFKAAGGDKGKRASAAVTFGRTTTGIVARGNLVNLDPTVQTIADISFAIVDEILAYYAPSAARAGAVKMGSEDDLKKSIDAKIKRLKELTK